MDKLKILQKELDEMVEENKSYDEIVKKSKELDYYITREMIKMHKNEFKDRKRGIEYLKVTLFLLFYRTL